MSSNTEKLQKRLASSGLGSRRDMEEAIAAGRVTVNGRLASVGDRVSDDDVIMLDGRGLPSVSMQSAPRVLMYNKPESEICTMSDPEGRPTVFEKLPTVRAGRWIAVGRLDINTTGLLIFTTDGALANSLMHPSSNIDREYLCRVRGDVDDDMLKRLREGVLLDDGLAKFTSITNGGSSEGSNHWFYVCLEEGRNREVRRLWESQGAQVSRLKRVRYGALTMPSRLKMGQWMEMETDQVAALYQMAGLTPPKTLAGLTPQQQHDRKRQDRQNNSAKPGVQKYRSKSTTERFVEKNNRDENKTPVRRDGLEWLDTVGDTPAKSRAPKTDSSRSATKAPTERASRSDRNAQPERTERSSRPETSSRPARSTRSETSSRPERSTRTETSARPERGARTETSSRPERTARTDTSSRPDRSSRPERSSSSNRDESFAGRSNPSKSASRTPKTDRAIREAKAGRFDNSAEKTTRSTTTSHAPRVQSERATKPRTSKESFSRDADSNESRTRRDGGKPRLTARPSKSTSGVMSPKSRQEKKPRR
jgi:23S rRNA pseudouridine2605 synthase